MQPWTVLAVPCPKLLTLLPRLSKSRVRRKHCLILLSWPAASSLPARQRLCESSQPEPDDTRLCGVFNGLSTKLTYVVSLTWLDRLVWYFWLNSLVFGDVFGLRAHWQLDVDTTSVASSEAGCRCGNGKEPSPRR